MIRSHQIYFTTFPLTMMINFIMVLFKLALKAFKHFVPAILKAFHVLTVLCALFQFSIDFAFCLRCLCKTTINHSNNWNMLDDERQTRNSPRICSSYLLLCTFHAIIFPFIRTALALYLPSRLFLLSSRNRSQFWLHFLCTKIFNNGKYWHSQKVAVFCSCDRNFIAVVFSNCKAMTNNDCMYT